MVYCMQSVQSIVLCAEASRRRATEATRKAQPRAPIVAEGEDPSAAHLLKIKLCHLAHAVRLGHAEASASRTDKMNTFSTAHEPLCKVLRSGLWKHVCTLDGGCTRSWPK